MAMPEAAAKFIDSLDCDTDIVSWINDALNQTAPRTTEASTSELTELDHHVTHLISTLDIACEETALELEHIIDDVTRGLPRLTYDLHFMKDGAINLAAALTIAQVKSRGVLPVDIAKVLEHLQTLDKIKHQMEAAREVLRDAESWSTLEMEFTVLLTEQNFTKAAERLAEANKSVVVSQNTADHDPRRNLMVSLQNQLEASLSSALVSAITVQDLTACRKYFIIFSNIQREVEFRNYYNASRRSKIVAMWRDAQLLDSESFDSPSDGRQFSDFLSHFYDTLLILLNTERVSIPFIFPNPTTTFTSFVISTFEGLQPSFSQRLSSLSSYHGDSALLPIIASFQATEKFAIGVSQIVEKMRYAAMVSPHPEDGGQLMQSTPMTRPSHARRRSSRMSISWRSGHQKNSNMGGIAAVLQDDIEWEHELFQPFLDYHLDYESLERRYLDYKLSKLAPEFITGQVNLTRVLKERTVDVFASAEDSISRCQTFTYGYGTVALVKALDKFFQSFIDSWASYLLPITSASAQNPKAEDPMLDIDYTQQDWDNFQMVLHLLSSSRLVFERVAAFEIKLWSYISSTASNYRRFQSDAFNYPMTPSRGLTQVFEQSPLNSAELQIYFDHSEAPVVREPFSAPTPTAASFRHSQLATAPGAVRSLLVATRVEISSFAKSCQVALQDTLLSPLKQCLSGYSSSSQWTVAGDTKQRHTVSANDLHLPSFSLTPSDTIQKVIQGLLSLPGLFEDFADDDALSFSPQTLPYLTDDIITTLLTSEVLQGQQNSLGAEVVSSIWLLSLGSGLLDHFVSVILPSIKNLSPVGSAQLVVDLESLSNVLRSLNVNVERLVKWKEFCELSDEAEHIMKGDRGIKDDILQQVVRMRGWVDRF